MNEELDSQLSAMFDDELPEDQCLLLARRLSRDDALKARWRRYAVMGAAIRVERQGAIGIRLETNLAARVSSVISAEPALAADAVARGGVRKAGGMRWWQPVAGGAIAAGVAAMSVLWIRASAPVGGESLLAQNAAQSAVTQTVADNSAPESYVVPATVERTPMVPSAELANYVVAHSEFSAPVNRRNMLSALVASEAEEEAGTGRMPGESDDANVVEVPQPNVEKAK
ncbi:MAG: sigma-E factor negative regulatory protein [Gammaproteobacteria bacterium]